MHSLLNHRRWSTWDVDLITNRNAIIAMVDSHIHLYNSFYDDFKFNSWGQSFHLGTKCAFNVRECVDVAPASLNFFKRLAIVVMRVVPTERTRHHQLQTVQSAPDPRGETSLMHLDHYVVYISTDTRLNYNAELARFNEKAGWGREVTADRFVALICRPFGETVDYSYYAFRVPASKLTGGLSKQTRRFVAKRGSTGC